MTEKDHLREELNTKIQELRVNTELVNEYRQKFLDIILKDILNPEEKHQILHESKRGIQD